MIIIIIINGLLEKAAISCVCVWGGRGKGGKGAVTPLVTGAQFDSIPFITTLCFLLLSQFLIQLCRLPEIPICLIMYIH